MGVMPYIGYMVSVVSFANIFSHSEGCLLFVVPFLCKSMPVFLKEGGIFAQICEDYVIDSSQKQSLGACMRKDCFVFFTTYTEHTSLLTLLFIKCVCVFPHN